MGSTSKETGIYDVLTEPWEQLGWCEGMLRGWRRWQWTSKAMRRQEGRKNVAGAMLDSVCHPGGQASWEVWLAHRVLDHWVRAKAVIWVVELRQAILSFWRLCMHPPPYRADVFSFFISEKTEDSEILTSLPQWNNSVGFQNSYSSPLN